MKFIKQKIKNLFLIKPSPFKDERGILEEIRSQLLKIN